VTRPGGRIRRRITRRQRKRGWIARSTSTLCRTSVRSVAASIDSSCLAAPCHVASLFGTGFFANVSGRARDQGSHLVTGERPCSASAARLDRHARRTPRALMSVRESQRSTCSATLTPLINFRFVSDDPVSDPSRFFLLSFANLPSSRCSRRRGDPRPRRLCQRHGSRAAPPAH
jgi:hypothetical protein